MKRTFLALCLVLALVGIVVGLWICVTLFHLRRHLQQEEESQAG